VFHQELLVNHSVPDFKNLISPRYEYSGHIMDFNINTRNFCVLCNREIHYHVHKSQMVLTHHRRKWKIQEKILLVGYLWKKKEGIFHFSKRHRVPKKTNMTHNFKFFSHYK
jgi:hypothetical protein